MPPKSKSKRGSASKKGSKRKKDDNSTVQERNAIIKEKMAAEKEKRLRRRKFTTIFLKVKQDKEYTLMKIAQQDVLSEWRPLMREMKKGELLKDLKATQSAFERSFDKKNELIHNLEEQLRKNNKDYDDALNYHMYNVDKMLEYFKKRLAEVVRLYADQKQSLVDILTQENSRMTDIHMQVLNYLLGIRDAVALRHKCELESWRMMVKLEEEQLTNKTMEDAIGQTVLFKEKISEVWADIKNRLRTYDKTMEPLREEYFKLRKMNNDSSDEIETLITRTHILNIGLASLDNRIDAVRFATTSQLKDLTDKKAVLRQKYNEELQRHKSHTFKSGKAVRVLALTVHSLISKMEEHGSKRDRLMLFIERCRKSERRNEKVDPFMSHVDIHDFDDNFEPDVDSTKLFYAAEDEEFDGETDFVIRAPCIQHALTCECDPCVCEMTAEDNSSNLNAPLNKLVNDYAFMERFWIRQNSCTLEIAALQNRRYILMRHNSDFKIALRNYMGGLNPLEHDTDKLISKAFREDKKEYGMFVKTVKNEQHRRERSRKVGGIRMH